MSETYFMRFRDKLKAAIAERGQKPTGKTMEPCPAHDDRNPSLMLKNRAGFPVFQCLAGCSEDAIIDALGISEDDVRAETSRAELVQDDQPADVYDYYVDDGHENPAYRKRRFVLRDANGVARDKTFDTLTATRYREVADDKRPPWPVFGLLDALNDLEEAGEPLTIVVTAGEKDCISATTDIEAHGLAATAVSVPHGETATGASVTAIHVLLALVRERGLLDRVSKIVVVFDLDEPGVRGALDLVESLRKQPPKDVPLPVHMAMPATHKPGHDLTDAYESGESPAWEVADPKDIIAAGAEAGSPMEAKARRLEIQEQLRALGETVGLSEDDKMHEQLLRKDFKLEATLQAAAQHGLRPVNLRNRGVLGFGPIDRREHYTAETTAETQLAAMFKATFGIELGRTEIDSALRQVRAHIMHDPVVDPPARVFRPEDEPYVYVDCGEQSARINECTSDVDLVAHPVQWWRDEGAQVLPTPNLSVDHTEAIRLFRSIANLTEHQVAMSLAWIIRAYESGENVLLLLKAAANRGKTATAHAISMCVEPRVGNPADQAITLPNNEWEWGAIATTHAAMVIDNLGALPRDMSDVPTLAVTGATTMKRGLYQDSRMLSLSLQSNLLVTALGTTGWKADLLTRTVTLEPPVLPATGRQDAEELERHRLEVAPQLLGAVLKLVGLVLAEKRTRDWTAHETHRVAGWGRTLVILDDLLGTSAHAEMMREQADTLAAQPVAPWVESIIAWAVRFPAVTEERPLKELRCLFAENTALRRHFGDEFMEPDRQRLPQSNRAAADMLRAATDVLKSNGVHVEKRRTASGNVWSIRVDGDSVSEIEQHLSIPIHAVDVAVGEDSLGGRKIHARRARMRSVAA